MKYRTLIVDDEPPARRSLRILLEAHPQIQVAAECDHAAAAVDAIRSVAPDIVFIDVQMPGATGIDVIREAGLGVVPVVIFTTAFAEYAIPAFEVQALDYLLKPFSDQRFNDVLARALRSLEQAARVRVDLEPKTLTIRDGARTLIIPFTEIEWIEAEDYYARIHAGARKPLVRRTLQSLAEELGDRFARVHRSAIVNLEHVREVQPIASGDQQIVLSSGADVRLSRKFRESFALSMKTKQNGR